MDRIDPKEKNWPVRIVPPATLFRNRSRWQNNLETGVLPQNGRTAGS
jgi:hypothetical protein